MTDTPYASIPLVQAVREFLDWQALDKGRSPNTVRASQQDLARFVTYCAAVQVQTLAQVDRVLLRSYQSQLARGTAGVALSAATRHRRLVALRSLLKFCAREEWSPGDLGVTIDLPKLPRRLPKPLDPGELERMTAEPPVGDDMDQAGLRDRALVAFLLSTGCRISEALALNRLDWNTSSVIVCGKGDVERSVVITDRARSEVDAYLRARDDDGPALFVSYSPGRAGRRLSVRGAEAVCTRLGLRNQVTKLHPHRFRHTAGTIVQDELGDPRVTADYLGHHGLGSVAGYTEVSSNRRAQAGDALTRRGM